MSKKPKTFSGRFNPAEVDAIERTCVELGIKPNQMIKEAVAIWMMIRPAATLLESTHFMELLKSASRKMKKTKSIDHKQFDPLIQKYTKKYGESEFERIEETLAEADKNYHILKKKKKVGRPQNPKRKRGKPKR